ncbi:hypothetical protein [Candidatus Njordibacter sp. Uisw_058]|jgi:hypothetical protein|uniref:hypothetical protein n=1 Tax=Candidatus Njordibacter sp. Uisw_058 TaxID=3230974 RepID=UPI003D3CA9F6|tara:strand:- start:39 stop:434 length:396 start_codon:yes stop_codon:yes gene_type:complete
MNKSGSLSIKLKTIMRSVWEYPSILIGFFIKTIAIIATFLLLNYGFKGFVTGLLVFLMGGGYLDLDPRDIMTIDALAVIFSFITGIWGVWVVRRLMSKKYYTLPRTKIIFWFLVFSSVIGLVVRVAITLDK